MADRIPSATSRFRICSTSRFVIPTSLAISCTVRPAASWRNTLRARFGLRRGCGRDPNGFAAEHSDQAPVRGHTDDPRNRVFFARLARNEQACTPKPKHKHRRRGVSERRADVLDDAVRLCHAALIDASASCCKMFVSVCASPAEATLTGVVRPLMTISTRCPAPGACPVAPRAAVTPPCTGVFRAISAARSTAAFCVPAHASRNARLFPGRATPRH